MKKRRRPQHDVRAPASVEVTAIRRFFFCGWSVELPVAFEGEHCDNGRTLRMFDESREVSISTSRIDRNHGVAFRAEDLFTWFPPPEMAGQRFARDDDDHAGRAVWVRVPSDRGRDEFLLVAVTVHRRDHKVAQMTFVTRGPVDLPWALEVWRGVAYLPEVHSALFPDTKFGVLEK